MRCQQCGAEVVEQSVYCHKCGQRVAPAAAGAAGPAAFKQPAGAATPPADADKILWEGSFSAKALYGTFVVCTLLAAAAVAAGVVFFAPFLPIAVGVALVILLWPLVVLMYRRMGVHYRLSPQRFIHERG